MSKTFNLELFFFFLFFGFSGQAEELQQVDALPLIESQTDEFMQTETVDDKGNTPTHIKWKRIKWASHYMLVLSRSSDFKDIVQYHTREPGQHVVVQANTAYFWKVTAFAKNGQRMSQKPGEPFSFIIEHAASKKRIGRYGP